MKVLNMLCITALLIGISADTVMASENSHKYVTTINLKNKYTPAEMELAPEALDLFIDDWKVELENVKILTVDPKINEPIHYQVVINAGSGYSFHGLKSSSIRSSFDSEIHNIILSDDETSVQIELTMMPPRVRLQSPSSLQWDGYIAEWDGAPETFEYEVELHSIRSDGKESGIIKKIVTNEESYDFSEFVLQDPRDYIFSVKALASEDDCYIESRRVVMDFADSLLIQDNDIGIFGGYWKRTEDGIQYKTSSSDILKGLQRVEGNTYSFDDSGYVQYGWVDFPDGKKRYFDKDTGQMKTGFAEMDGNIIYLSEDGSFAVNCWSLVDEQWYYSDNMGNLVKGWYLIDGKWYYFLPDGKMNQERMLYCSNGMLASFNEDGSLSRTINVHSLMQNVDKTE